MSSELFQDFMDGYIKPCGSHWPLVVEHNGVVMCARLNSIGSKFSIPVL